MCYKGNFMQTDQVNLSERNLPTSRNGLLKTSTWYTHRLSNEWHALKCERLLKSSQNNNSNYDTYIEGMHLALIFLYADSQ